MIVLSMRGVSPCTDQISGKFSPEAGNGESKNVADPILIVRSGFSGIQTDECRDDHDRPDQETVKAGFFNPVIGKELADFWEELLINQYCNY